MNTARQTDSDLDPSNRNARVNRVLRRRFKGIGRLAVFIAIVGLSGCNRGEVKTSDPAEFETLVVTGVLVDSRCHSQDSTHVGLDHTRDGTLVKSCATICAKQGFPTAVLVAGDADIPVWMLVANAQALADYMAGTVRVTGTVRSRGVLIPDRIELQSGDGWTIIM